MTVWKVSRDGRAAHFFDPALDLSVLAFSFEDSLFAQVSLKTFVSDASATLVLGPFAHFAAVSDFVTGFLIRLESDHDDGVYGIETVEPSEIPEAPEVPLERSFAREAMSPVMAADLAWEAQELLDAGEDVVDGVARLERGYVGVRYDERSYAEYVAQGSLDVLYTVQEAAAVPVDLAVAAPVAAAPPGPEIPDVIHPIPVETMLEPVTIDRPADVVSFPNIPRAAIPRTTPFTLIDWMSLPVRVVEERLSDHLSVLRSQMAASGGAR